MEIVKTTEDNCSFNAEKKEKKRNVCILNK